MQAHRRSQPLRRPRFLIVLGAVVAAALLAFTVGVANTEPAAIQQQRAEVSRIQGELDRIAVEAEQAAEAYNGAMYDLAQVKARIASNAQTLRRTKKNLGRMQGVLNRRLVQLYTTRDPSIAEILVTSGNLTEVADRLDMAQRLGAHDSQVVTSLREDRERLAALRRELIADRATAAQHVKRAATEKARVEGLLQERQAVLASANAKLERLLDAERERQRREAEAQARLARERAAALAAQERSAQTAERADGTQATTPSADSGDQGGSADSGDSSEAPASSSDPAPSGGGNAEAARIALQYLGVPYRWGGADPSGFDCSGLASYVYGRIGKSVPHYTVAAYNAFPKVSAGSLQPGDLVFWRGLGHMGIYIGGGQYVHAPQTGDVVKVSSMSDRSDFAGAVRP